MSVLSIIPNGASGLDVRETINNLIQDINRIELLLESLEADTVSELIIPILARDGTPGTLPMAWTIENSDLLYAGYYWNVERATSQENLNNGILTGSTIQMIATQDLYSGKVEFPELGSTPIGPVALRMRVGRDEGGTALVWGDWSDTLFDDIAPSYGAVLDPAKLKTGATLSTDRRSLTSTDVGYNRSLIAVSNTALSAAIGYVETTFVSSYVVSGRSDPWFGLVPTDYNYLSDTYTIYIDQYGSYRDRGAYIRPLPTTAAGGTVGMLVHKETGKLWLRFSNQWYPEQPSFNPDGTIKTGTGYDTGMTSFLFAIANDGGDTTRINTGQDSFVYPLLDNVPLGWA